MASKPPRLALKLSIATAILAAVAWALIYALRPIATVATVTRGKAIDSVPGSVTVQAEYEMDLKSEYPGRIMRSELDAGKPVKTGDLLVQIDPSKLELEIEKTANELEAQKKRVTIGSPMDVDLDNARDDLANKERLLKLGGIAETEVVRQRRFVKALQQRRDLEKVESEQSLAGLDNSLKTERLQLARMTITAPFDGVVAQVIARPGDMIGADAPIAHLIASNRTVEAKVSEEKFADIKIGQKATVRFLTYGDQQYQATVAKILPTADPATQRYIVHLKVDIAPEKLVPGITGEVIIDVGEHEKTLLVPRRALYGRSLLVVKNGRVESRTPDVGYVSLNEVEILSGVAEGESVIVDQIERFRPGDRVRTVIEK
jgi:RND family efflux transporter MFP subunit